MSFFEVDTDKVVEDSKGIVYIMRFKFRHMDDYVYKIGITTRPPIDRMLEVVRSFHNNKNNRYIPDSSLKRFRKTTEYFAKEAALHRYFKEYQYLPEHRHDGSNELFTGMSEELLLAVYADCVDDIDIEDEDYKCSSS